MRFYQLPLTPGQACVLPVIFAMSFVILEGMKSNAKNTDEYLQDLPDWQRANLIIFRQLVHQASPNVAEEIKWGVPVFLIDKKMVFAMSSFKAHTKYNFIQNGATLNDKERLFNNGLDSKKSRSINLREDEAIDKTALADLVTQAVDML